MKMTRILYASDFHGSDSFYRKYLAAALQYQVNVLVVGGDVTGKAMVPVIHLGSEKYEGFLFGKKECANGKAERDRLIQKISNVGFYPIVLEPDEANELENDQQKMSARFEQEMCARVQIWLTLFEEKLKGKGIVMYFMPGNDDLYSIDQVIDEYPNVHNPDGKVLWIDEDHEIFGISNANMTPWKCIRDVEEDVLEQRLGEIGTMLKYPERAVANIHVPPYNSGLDVCPQLDKDLKIMTSGGQVLTKPVGSAAVRSFIEKKQPMVSLHGHIHEAAGHTHIGRTLAVNAGSEYAEGIMKAAIVNLERDKVKGHILISG